ELVPKKEGMYYEVSPFALTCKEENYYLIAYDHREEKIKHYRVDKMAKTETLPGKTRDGHALFEQFDLASYTNRTFGMFGGREETVTLDIDTRLMGVVLDRFGKDIYMRNLDNGKLRVRIKVAISNQFFGWMTGLSTGAKLVSPASVVEEYLDHINNLKRQYEQK
ncbi:MAG: WYL domain-containing protein, partial [Lachnospiraceae bacterium]|nr:WYL domain-containing protein [Lachnospiraceae bacterium]